MIRINVTRINALRSIAGSRDSVAWGKDTRNIASSTWGNLHALAFSAVLIACSFAVGCSSDKPKPVSSNNQIPVTQPSTPIAATPAPVMEAENKPAVKKVVHRKPANVSYTDKTYGVTFEYPRRYAIETGNAAAEVLIEHPVSMNFVEPGGVALAAVELPETGFANTDFSSAFFNVSVHKNLTADQCNEFAVPEPKNAASSAATAAPAAQTLAATTPQTGTSTPAATTESKPDGAAPVETAKVAESQPATTQQTEPVKTSSESMQPASSSAAATVATNNEQQNATKTSSDAASSNSAIEPQGSKLLVGDMELHATEAVSGEGTRQSDSKYFHVYQNGACYEFALNVTTIASQNDAGLMKHVDRDKVFSRLEKILDTVKISPVTPEANAEAPKTNSPVAAETPAQ